MGSGHPERGLPPELRALRQTARSPRGRRDHDTDPRDHDADPADHDADLSDHDAPILAITMRRSA
jgi:hypothetical protein